MLLNTSWGKILALTAKFQLRSIPVTVGVFVCQTLAVLPDQDSFYDVTDSLEQLGMETIIHKHMNNKGTEPDLRAQFTIYEVTTSRAAAGRRLSGETAVV